MTIIFTLRSSAAGLALTLAAGCASVQQTPAPVPDKTSAATGAPMPDNAGARRIRAGAGRT